MGGGCNSSCALSGLTPHIVHMRYNIHVHCSVKFCIAESHETRRHVQFYCPQWPYGLWVWGGFCIASSPRPLPFFNVARRKREGAWYLIPRDLRHPNMFTFVRGQGAPLNDVKAGLWSRSRSNTENFCALYLGIAKRVYCTQT